MRKSDLVIHYSDCGLTGLSFKEPSLTQPQFEDECNLRIIIDRFLKTGEMPRTAIRSPLPVQDANMLPGSFEVAMDRSTRLKQAFDLLPLEKRNEFNNDPLAWLDSLEAEKLASLDPSVPAPGAVPAPAPGAVPAPAPGAVPAPAPGAVPVS